MVSREREIRSFTEKGSSSSRSYPSTNRGCYDKLLGRACLKLGAESFNGPRGSLFRVWNLYSDFSEIFPDL